MHRIAAFGLALCLAQPTGALASACGTLLHLSVEPAARSADVAEVLRKRLENAGAVAPRAEVEGAGVAAVLPTGLAETLLTRPGRIEFRLVASEGEAGAIPLPRVDGAGMESVSPEIILDETHLREFVVRPGDGGAALGFHFDTHAMKNLMAASNDAINRKLAILIDDRIVADPVIRAPIGSRTGEIPAGSLASAAELAQVLRSARLPAKVAVTGREEAACRG